MTSAKLASHFLRNFRNPETHRPMTRGTLVVPCFARLKTLVTCTFQPVRGIIHDGIKLSTMADSCSRSSRRIVGQGPEQEATEPCRLSCLRKSYCTQWNWPSTMNCSGCAFFLQGTEGKPPSGKPRHETHRSRKYECQKAWLSIADLNERKKGDSGGSGGSYKIRSGDRYIETIENWMKENESSSFRRLKATPASATHSATKRAISIVYYAAVKGMTEETSPLTTSPESSENSNTTDDGRKKKKTKEDIEVRNLSVTSQGVDFEIEGVPKTHVLVTKSRLSRLKKVEEKVKTMEGALTGERFTSKVLPLTRTQMAVCLSSAPSLPLTQAAVVMPMFVGAFLNNFGLLDKTSIESFAQCFPSENYLRNIMYEFAAEKQSP